MADATYQTNVYMKQPGDEQVIANGGQQTVESGGKVQLESGGELEGLAGGIADLQTGFLFYLADTTSTAVDLLKYMIYNETTLTDYVSSVSVLALSVFTPAYGYCFFSLAAGCSKASIKLPTPSKGMALMIYLSGAASNACVSIKAQSDGGASCVDMSGVVISSVNFKKSNTSVGVIIFRCFADGVWTILDAGKEATINFKA